MTQTNETRGCRIRFRFSIEQTNVGSWGVTHEMLAQREFEQEYPLGVDPCKELWERLDDTLDQVRRVGKGGQLNLFSTGKAA